MCALENCEKKNRFKVQFFVVAKRREEKSTKCTAYEHRYRSQPNENGMN